MRIVGKGTAGSKFEMVFASLNEGPAPSKVCQLDLEFSRNVNERTEHEEEPLYGRADHRDLEAA